MGEKYSPLYFLASVGAGGLATTFFMYLLYWVPHPGRPVPVFEDIMAYLSTADILGQSVAIFAMAAIAFFVYLNIRLLVWNLKEFAIFKKTDAYINHQKSNAQTQVKAQALALAMTVNATFTGALVFIPNLWSIIEYLFPIALVVFLAIGVLAFKNLGEFLGRVLVEGGFDRAANNNFAQLLPAFAFSMIGVGLAAPAAMSTVKVVAGISLISSIFFLITAVILMTVALILGFAAMMKHGAAKETSPTLLIVIPIMTVLGILVVRQDHGLHVLFDGHTTAADTMMFLAKLISIQVVFALLGIMVLRRQKYMSHYVTGADKSPGSYALICPGVAFSVLFQFFINKGLVATELVDKFSTGYWALTALALISQFAMVWLLFKLNSKHFGSEARQAMVAAE
jgi:hypothetical protein